MAALITQTSKTVGAPQLDQALLEIGQFNNDLYDDQKKRGSYILFLRDGKMLPRAEIKESIEANDALEMRVMNWEKFGKAANFGIAIGLLGATTVDGVPMKSFRQSHSLAVQGPDAFMKAWNTIQPQVS